MTRPIVILGVFVADASFRADRMPRMGETLLGRGFALGPGGKGSNQAVAAARAGADVHLITRLGRDPFADMALRLWSEAGITPEISQHAEHATGAAAIFIDAASGDNAIIICPGVANTISAADLEARAELIAAAALFVTQLEQPMAAALRGLQIARAAGVATLLNPAPAAELPEGMLALCDYLTPNESEAAALTGRAVTTVDDAARAAEALIARGVGTVIVTLGDKGALFHDGAAPVHVPAFEAGPVVETTGAGDAFNGAFAAALARGEAPLAATRFGCAAAALSVTRPGTAPSMPELDEIRALLARA
ncbi:MAG: ribokinase [Sedimentitalea sp.]|nr:ribokinase [Sedimentitalea sp.]